jgi:hypothetical protein
MKRIYILFLLIIVTSFTQCSIPTHIYVQNLTAETVKFKIVYKRPITELSYYQHDKIFDYTEGIVSPKMFRQETLKTLKFQKVGDSAMAIELPKLSTARIENTNNTSYYLYIDYIEYNEKKLELEDFIAIGKRKGSHVVYTIKPHRNYNE